MQIRERRDGRNHLGISQSHSGRNGRNNVVNSRLRLLFPQNPTTSCAETAITFQYSLYTCLESVSIVKSLPVIAAGCSFLAAFFIEASDALQKSF